MVAEASDAGLKELHSVVATREQLVEMLKEETRERKKFEEMANRLLEETRPVSEALRSANAVIKYFEQHVRELIIEVADKEADCVHYEGVLSCMSREQVAAAERQWEKKQSTL